MKSFLVDVKCCLTRPLPYTAPGRGISSCPLRRWILLLGAASFLACARCGRVRCGIATVPREQAPPGTRDTSSRAAFLRRVLSDTPAWRSGPCSFPMQNTDPICSADRDYWAALPTALDSGPFAWRTVSSNRVPSRQIWELGLHRSPSQRIAEKKVSEKLDVLFPRNAEEAGHHGTFRRLRCNMATQVPSFGKGCLPRWTDNIVHRRRCTGGSAEVNSNGRDNYCS